MLHWIKKLSLYHVSIKTLTLLGFSLVTLPLVLAFLYSANQVNLLSKQGTAAIFTVAERVENTRKIRQTLNGLERFASQYIVLKEQELFIQYIDQQNALEGILQQEFSYYHDQHFANIAEQYQQKLNQIRMLVTESETNHINLPQLQQHFKQLTAINQQLALHSNKQINLQAKNMETFANQVKQTMLFSLLIIPITLIIAGVFIVLITQPLKALLKRINVLEQGNFQQAIHINGSAEIEEIAEALELMRSRLHALELQKSSFIRHISHELKTPLAAIREGTELLYDNSVGSLNSGQQEITKIIKNSVNRLQQLIEDLLDFNIVLDSTSLQDAEIINVTDEIEHNLAVRLLDLKRKQITVIKHISPITLQCNSKQLSVIIDNLLSNAIKFSPDNGEIQISAKVSKQILTLSITDQGCGISPELHSKIFDAFYQGPSAHNSQIKSSGLGLTIVKELLMRLNGTITITINSSTRQPSKTTFIVQLPKAQLMPLNSALLSPETHSEDK